MFVPAGQAAKQTGRKEDDMEKGGSRKLRTGVVTGSGWDMIRERRT